MQIGIYIVTKFRKKHFVLSNKTIRIVNIENI